MTAIIRRASVVGGHDGRAEIEVEVGYANGGTSTIALDAEACMASLDRAGIASIDELPGQPWTVMLPALQTPPHQHPNGGGSHVRSHYP